MPWRSLKNLYLTEYRNNTSNFDFVFSETKKTSQRLKLSHHLPPRRLQRLFHHARASEVCPHSLPRFSGIKSPGGFGSPQFKKTPTRSDGNFLGVLMMVMTAMNQTNFGQVVLPYKYHVSCIDRFRMVKCYDQSSFSRALSLFPPIWMMSSWLFSSVCICKWLYCSACETQPKCMKYTVFIIIHNPSITHTLSPVHLTMWIHVAVRKCLNPTRCLFNFGLELTTKILTLQQIFVSSKWHILCILTFCKPALSNPLVIHHIHELYNICTHCMHKKNIYK